MITYISKEQRLEIWLQYFHSLSKTLLLCRKCGQKIKFNFTIRQLCQHLRGCSENIYTAQCSDINARRATVRLEYRIENQKREAIRKNKSWINEYECE